MILIYCYIDVHIAATFAVLQELIFGVVANIFVTGCDPSRSY